MGKANGSATVTVADCPDCVKPPPPCPSVSVSCPSDVELNAPITFTASVTGGEAGATWTYNWSVSAGTISSGQGTSTITVDTTGVAGGTSVTATVNLGGADPSCTGTTASCTTFDQAAPARKLRSLTSMATSDSTTRRPDSTTTRFGCNKIRPLRRQSSCTAAVPVKRSSVATVLRTISSIRAESRLDVSRSWTVDAVQT